MRYILIVLALIVIIGLIAIITRSLTQSSAEEKDKITNMFFILAVLIISGLFGLIFIGLILAE